MLNIAVLVSGGGTNLQALLDAESRGGIPGGRIACVISSKPEAYALERAKRAGVATEVLVRKGFATPEEYDAALFSLLDKYDTGLVVMAGFMTIISDRVVQRYPNRIINIHPSLIPSFCGKDFYGLKVHEGALARGVKVTGATVHFVDKGTDTGPIILQKAVEVQDGDTPEILQRRVMEEAEWVILPRAIDLIANGKITVTDGKVTKKS